MDLIEEKVFKVFSDILGVKIDEIDEDVSMESLVEWDSSKHMELIIAIEENFDIPQLSMDEIVEMISLKNIIKILKEKGC